MPGVQRVHSIRPPYPPTPKVRADALMSLHGYLSRKRVEEDHAFLINSMPGGTSERVAQLKVDEDTTFRRVRRLIEVHPQRRTYPWRLDGTQRSKLIPSTFQAVVPRVKCLLEFFFCHSWKVRTLPAEWESLRSPHAILA